jgi:hypothetical protein
MAKDPAKMPEAFMRTGKIMQRIECETRVRCNGLISSFSHNHALVDGIKELKEDE